METFLIKALQLVAALSLLVLVHEFGHYIFARIFNIRVDKFYLFFNPGFSLLKYDPRQQTIRLIAYGDDNAEKALMTLHVGTPRPAMENGRSSWRDTIYGIGWLPLGGYCKIAGMVDESMDKEQLAQAPKDWEFRSRPAYQRLLVMIGGVLFNFILAVLIYIGMAFEWGQQTIRFEDAYAGLDFVPAAQKVGFRNGDIPVLINGKPFDSTARDVSIQLVEADEVSVLRNGTDTVTIAIPDDFMFRLNDDRGFFSFRLPVFVGQLMNGEPAIEAGLAVGDHIVMVDTVAVGAFSEFSPEIARYAGKEVEITVVRDGAVIKMPITPNEYGKIGIQLSPITDVYPVTVVNYTLLEAIPEGVSSGVNMLANYVGQMKHIFSREGAESLGGFGTIGSIFPERWSWYGFWSITAFLSVALAFMNIIPIPALDGGHVMFLFYEMITRRQPSEKFLEYAQYCGMALLFILLLYANLNDVYRFFIK